MSVFLRHNPPYTPELQMNPEIVKFISLSGLTPCTLLSNTPSSGPVAQLVEQLTFNQWVTGSNPVGLTIYFKGLAEIC
jgi:hypothetical protein